MDPDVVAFASHVAASPHGLHLSHTRHSPSHTRTHAHCDMSRGTGGGGGEGWSGQDQVGFVAGEIRSFRTALFTETHRRESQLV